MVQVHCSGLDREREGERLINIVTARTREMESERERETEIESERERAREREREKDKQKLLKLPGLALMRSCLQILLLEK